MTTRTIRQVSARVFCQLEGSGGNPVTIFTANGPISSSQGKQLAQRCEWESVMVDTSSRALRFYMPTGEEVSFCAHAAMGGVLQLYDQLEKPFPFHSAMKKNKIHHNGSSSFTAIVHDDNIVSLELREEWEAFKVAHPPSLHRLLREACGVQSTSLVRSPGPIEYPTFVNFSTSRPKTLVYINSLEALHDARPPTNPQVFQRACDALQTTGLYLYSPVPDESDSFQCRQFPRASSYAEDPATGIAASALAVALQRQINNDNATALVDSVPRYKFYQGTAMGRPSLILVENLQFHQDENDAKERQQEEVSFRLLGKVEVDDEKDMEESLLQDE